MAYQYTERLSDAVIGLAIGDAMGVPFEFEERGSFTCTGMTGSGVHNMPAGTWSDDTSMTIATAKGLRDYNGEIHPGAIRRNFVNWLRQGDFTPDGKCFGIGRATFVSLTTGEPQSRFEDNGNGALMRILPLSFTDAVDDQIDEVSGITHGHGISKTACRIYVHVARRLLAGQTIIEILPSLIGEAPFGRLSKIDQLPEDEIKSSGYVIDTLEAALWAMAKEALEPAEEDGDRFAGAVLRAVNLGGDTDTIGAVTGGLAGIVYGLDGARASQWRAALRKRELIEECL